MCQTARLSAKKSASMPNDAMPAVRSVSAMVHLRFHRSTRTPAKGIMTTLGTKAKNAVRATAVADPVSVHIQMTRPNWVMPVPMMEMSWPNHTTV